VLAARFTKPVPAQRVLAAQQAAASVTIQDGELAALAGRYHSTELDADYDLAAGRNALIVRRPRGEIDTLQAIEADLFRTRAYSLRFVRQAGHPSSFTLDNGRARGIEFERMP